MISMAEKFWLDDIKGFPCKNCQERHTACHQDCERYKKAQKEHFDRRRQRADVRAKEKGYQSVRRRCRYKSRDRAKMPEDKEW